LEHAQERCSTAQRGDTRKSILKAVIKKREVAVREVEKYIEELAMFTCKTLRNELFG
jgi:hypothetical protein